MADSSPLLAAVHGIVETIDAFQRGPNRPVTPMADSLPDQRRLVDVLLRLLPDEGDPGVSVARLRERACRSHGVLCVRAVGVRHAEWVAFLHRHGDAFCVVRGVDGTHARPWSFHSVGPTGAATVTRRGVSDDGHL